MNERVKSLLIYAAKCATATLSIYTISALINYKDNVWCLISALLILSPDGKDSFSLALTRIKANMVGASVGMACLVISPSNMWIVSLALCVTLSICYLLKIDAGARAALAATVIIMLHPEGNHVWDTAIERIIAVLAGCALGLLITYVFHFKVRPNKKLPADNRQEA